jgi:hypothetical protein
VWKAALLPLLGLDLVVERLLERVGQMHLASAG